MTLKILVANDKNLTARAQALVQRQISQHHDPLWPNEDLAMERRDCYMCDKPFWTPMKGHQEVCLDCRMAKKGVEM